MTDNGGKKFDPSKLANGPPKHPVGAGFGGPATLLGRTQADREAGKPKILRELAKREASMMVRRLEMLERWKHKNEGTPETHEKSGMDLGAIGRMYARGDISADQWAYAEEISYAAEMIERDVSVRIVDYAPRIDCGASGRDALVEGILSVRRQIAYREWRNAIPHPRAVVLAMLIGERVGYHQAARTFGMGWRRARNLLITSLDLWPSAMSIAEEEADAASIAAAHAGLI